MSTTFKQHLERNEGRGSLAADALIARLARKSFAFLLTEMPWQLLLLQRSERKRLALLRGRILRQQIGTCERALGALGRRMDHMLRWRR